MLSFKENMFPHEITLLTCSENTSTLRYKQGAHCIEFIDIDKILIGTLVKIRT